MEIFVKLKSPILYNLHSIEFPYLLNGLAKDSLNWIANMLAVLIDLMGAVKLIYRYTFDVLVVNEVNVNELKGNTLGKLLYTGISAKYENS